MNHLHFSDEQWCNVFEWDKQAHPNILTHHTCSFVFQLGQQNSRVHSLLTPDPNQCRQARRRGLRCSKLTLTLSTAYHKTPATNSMAFAIFQNPYALHLVHMIILVPHESFHKVNRMASDFQNTSKQMLRH